MNKDSLIARQHTGGFLDGIKHGAQNIHHLYILGQGTICHMVTQFRRDDSVAYHCIISGSFLYHSIDLLLVLHIGHTDNFKSFLYKLAGGGFDNGFRSFANRIGYSINNRIILRYYDNYLPYLLPNLLANG